MSFTKQLLLLIIAANCADCFKCPTESCCEYSCVYNALKNGLLDSDNYPEFASVFLLNYEGFPNVVYINTTITTFENCSKEIIHVPEGYLWGETTLIVVFGPLLEIVHPLLHFDLLLFGFDELIEVALPKAQVAEDIDTPWIVYETASINIDITGCGPLCLPPADINYTDAIKRALRTLLTQSLAIVTNDSTQKIGDVNNQNINALFGIFLTLHIAVCVFIPFVVAAFAYWYRKTIKKFEKETTIYCINFVFAFMPFIAVICGPSAGFTKHLSSEHAHKDIMFGVIVAQAILDGICAVISSVSCVLYCYCRKYRNDASSDSKCKLMLRISNAAVSVVYASLLAPTFIHFIVFPLQTTSLVIMYISVGAFIVILVLIIRAFKCTCCDCKCCDKAEVAPSPPTDSPGMTMDRLAMCCLIVIAITGLIIILAIILLYIIALFSGVNVLTITTATIGITGSVLLIGLKPLAKKRMNFSNEHDDKTINSTKEDLVSRCPATEETTPLQADRSAAADYRSTSEHLF